MDFKASLGILSERLGSENAGKIDDAAMCGCMRAQCAHKLAFAKKCREAASSSSSTTSTEELEKLSDLDLLNILTSLQSERFQSYVEFNAALGELLEGESAEANGDRLIAYPLLCAEMTARFSILSKKVIEIKECLNARSRTGLGTLVASLQEMEKEKLVVNAAKHLDMIQSVFPGFQGSVGGTEFKAQPDYTSRRLVEIDAKIAGIIESIQCEKCDLSDTEAG